MKEFKILAVIVALVGITYYGIEPYAHHVMHPEPAPVDYSFDGKQEAKLLLEDAKAKAEAVDDNKKLSDEAKAKAKAEITTAAQSKADDTLAFWGKVADVYAVTGNAQSGKALVEANCLACHSLTAAGNEPIMDNASLAASYGVVPPDLSHAGRIYEGKFLAGLIMNPVKAMHLQHKFGPETGKTFPMPASDWMSAQEIMDMVAYLQSVAVAAEDTKESRKATFEAACVRCHDMGYAGIKALSPVEHVKTYLGATPPDLSMYIRSRGEHYLHNFINDPQRLLHGTSMPRVGLTQTAEKEVVTYMEEVGDSKKAEREGLGPWVLLYMAIFAVLAFLWKRQVWSEVH